MYEYHSDVLYTDIKWLTDKAEPKDVAELDKLINFRAQDGWELVTYSYMSTALQMRGATLITFKRKIEEQGQSL